MAKLVELHVHLEGTMPPRLIRELALRNQVPLDPSILLNEQQYRWGNFLDFIHAYDVVSDFIQNSRDLAYITYDYLQSVALAGGAYVELTISPDHAAKVGIPYPEQIAAITDACKRAEDELGIVSRCIVVLVRHEGLKRCEEVLSWVLRHPNPMIVGIGLAGDEAGFPPGQFATLFQRARDAGLGLTAHAGEWCGPKQIQEAVERLGIRRLGHGVRAIEDLGLLRELIAMGIHFELCPGSNVSLGIYPNLLKHPVVQFKELGASFSLNSDDPPFFATTVANEYAQAKAVLGFTEEELKQISLNAITASFAEDNLKQALMKTVLN